MSEQDPGSPHHANRAFYDRIAHSYDALADSNEHRAREAGQAALALQPGEKVLEIGFGTGNSLIQLAEAVGETGSAHGIDISSGMRDVTQKKLEERGLTDRVSLELGDARQLPYDDNSFDAVFTSMTLELFPLEDIPLVLADVRRVLRSGGRFGVVSMATVHEGEHDSMLESAYKWFHRHFPHIVDCQPIDVEKFVQEAGFQVDQVVNMEIWTMPVRAVIGVNP
ncbi:class I SAM-dependent methyltransferase [Lignipirellula cremea]|uniref:Demethylmenaquinone methyltransferase n=1 Tax=Lignipirellula cremea TaxID=2528010 RepID=A0A518E3L3_9BACT|nr:methyltransferase domain-containing protein [Lignipirellula cremea]QDU98685.1 Demethylmenaquinone methyltransferase [Lignipirellula cremea]